MVGKEGNSRIRCVEDLDVYNRSFDLAMEIFSLTKGFPKEEAYSLTDQIRRASRSVAINVREGFAKRRYESVFIRHLNDALGSSEEVRGWLMFSQKCGYLSEDITINLEKQYSKISAMLFSLMKKWKSREEI